MPTAASTRWTTLLAAGLVGLSLVTVSAPLDGDVRYEIGAQATSPESAAGTFTHRPLLYRLVMAGLIAGADRTTGDLVAFERAMRAESLVLTGLAGLLLWLGLRRRWPAIAATLSLTVAAALALLGPAVVLEPDWLTVVLTVAGVGLALALPSRPPWGVLSALLGGALITAAAAVKVVTLPIALIGLLALLLVDRRRCALATAGAVLAGLAYLVAVARWAPWEYQWMVDTAAMVPDRGRPQTVAEAQAFLGNVAVLWPAAALLPAALVGLSRNRLLAAVIAVLLAWLPVTLQNQYFVYHAVAVPVLGAVCLYGAVRRTGPLLALPVLGLSGWTGYVLSTGADWRVAHQAMLFTVAAAAAGGLVLLAVGGHVWRHVWSRRAEPRPAAAVLATLLVSAVWLPTSAPTAAESVTLSSRENTPATNRASTAGQLVWAEAMRQRIGADTPVTYLTFGTTNYMLGNPSTCEFPTSVFLQRSRTVRRQEGTPTWRANLRCLTDKPGRLLVYDPQWFLLRRQPPEVKAAFTAAFDCRTGFTIDRIQVCGRRG